ncbi:MAG: ribonuclease III [Clostridia bacterium]|nr:ribonuclease III [Clostridia bacterium]
MAIGREILELESIIGYNFSDVSRLENALTHSSYSNEMRVKGIEVRSNERLEFLGDAILGAVISEYLFSNFKKHREGSLTKMRQRIVCEGTLAKIAGSISLGAFLNLGNGEEQTGCRERPKVLADAMEALIAAIYLDCLDKGSEDYKSIIITLFANEINSIAGMQNTDYKTMLQQLVEQDGSSLLEYKIVETTGPEHNKRFTVSAYINNNEVGRGTAAKRQMAEMQAAKMALGLFGVTT